MKKMNLFLTLIFMITASFSQSSQWFKGTYEQAKTIAGQEEKMILILFSCGDG